MTHTRQMTARQLKPHPCLQALQTLARWGTLALWLGLTSPAQAQSHGLQALLGRALVQHPSVLQARSQAKAAGHELGSAEWGRYPSLSTALRSDTSTTGQSTTRLEQPLWTGGKITGQIKVAQANERAALAQVEEAQTQVLTQVSTAFFELLRQEARLQGATQNVEEHEKLLALIQRRSKAEISPPADETLAQARLQQALSERIQIARQRDAARVSLTQWCGEPVERVTAPRTIAFVPPASAQQALERALAASPAYRRLKAQAETAEAQIEVSRAQAMPNLVAGYQRSWGVLYGQPRDSSYLSLQFTPGAGLSALSNQKAAVSRQEAARAEAESLQLNLSAQLGATLTELDALAAQIKPARALLDGTSEVVDSYLRQYQVGRKNWLDVLNAQREKTSALYNLADMQYGLQSAQVRLMIQTGDLRSDELAAIHD